MGMPKHGKLSSRTKNSARYKAEGRLEKNKAKRAKKVAALAEKRAKKAAAKAKKGIKN